MTVCIDMGATEIKATSIRRTENGVSVGNLCKFPTNAHLGREGIVSALRSAVSSQICDDTRGIAIASAGDIDTKTSKITYATENLPGMIGFDFAEFCKQEFALKAKAINDAHAALLGEVVYGAAKDHRDKRVAMLTLGSGVGGGYYKNGGIWADAKNDFGRFGHICFEENGRECTCGKRGCIEMYLSGRAIHKDAAKIGIDGADIFEKYALGVEANLKFVSLLRERLRSSLNKVYEVSPFDLCIIGGGVADWMGDQFFSITKDLGYEVVRATLGNTAGMWGAYARFNSAKDENENS